MNIREQIKKRLTFEQRRRIIRKWVGFRATFAPGRKRAQFSAGKAKLHAKLQ